MLVVALAMNVSWQADTIIPSEGSLGFMLRRDQVKEEELMALKDSREPSDL
jgi:hypothetical protein